jgi:hypothetical protein
LRKSLFGPLAHLLEQLTLNPMVFTENSIA